MFDIDTEKLSSFMEVTGIFFKPKIYLFGSLLDRQISQEYKWQSINKVLGLTDQSESRRFLEATKGNLEKAINLFLMQDSGNKRITEQNRVKSVSNDDVVVINHDIKNPPKENDKNDSEQRWIAYSVNVYS